MKPETKVATPYTRLGGSRRRGHVPEGIAVEEAERLLHAVQRFDQCVGPVTEAAHARINDLPPPIVARWCKSSHRDRHGSSSRPNLIDVHNFVRRRAAYPLAHAVTGELHEWSVRT